MAAMVAILKFFKQHLLPNPVQLSWNLMGGITVTQRFRIMSPDHGGGGWVGEGGGGHIVFSADPVGVGIASCPHSIYLLNRHILAKLTQIYHWEGKKCWLDFGDLDPIFKVTGGLRLLENGLSASCLLKEWIDFNQTCTSILLGHVKELIRFWWPWLHFQGHRKA